ncbi:MAG: DsbA family protein [Nannocystaceae bacterium]
MSTLRRTLALTGVVVLGLAALADAAYLTLVHVDLELGAGGVGKVCHAFSRTGCEVTGGRFGAIFGVPVAAIGGGGALAILASAILGVILRRRDDHPVHGLVVLLGLGAVIASLIMAGLSLVEGAYCPFCVFWYLINLSTFAAAVLASGRGVGESVRLGLGGLVSPVGLGALAAFVAGVGGYLALEGAAHDRIAPEVAVMHQLDIHEALSRPQVKLDLGDNPRKQINQGAAGDPIELVEFSDFECPYCRTLWEQAEGYFEATTRPITVVFLNFPLDAACNPMTSSSMHPQACLAAYAGECAHQQGRFWTYADRLFDRQPDLSRADLLEAAGDEGLDVGKFEACLDDPATAQAVRADIELGRKAGVRGTPTVLFDGYRVSGVLRRPFFEAMLTRLRGPAR